jgi:hypothetical protein
MTPLALKRAHSQGSGAPPRRRFRCIGCEGTKLKADVHLANVESHHLRRGRGLTAQSRLLTHGLPQSCDRAVVGIAGTIREQPGEENIPNDPKHSQIDTPLILSNLAQFGRAEKPAVGGSIPSPATI